MKKRIVAFVIVVMVALAALFAYNASPASAHNQDNYSWIYCQASRPNTNQTIYHSSAVDLEPGYVIYYCYGDYAPQDLDYQWWVKVNVNTGAWTVPWNYQNCDNIDCSVTARGYGH